MVKPKDDRLDHLVTNTSSNQSGSNDFVKKLYQMLQEDKYRAIVRWTKNGDSFVVIDTNEFTKDILPRHFKHSNFASFVRQLNKYDFHKVKVSNVAKRNYEYGDDAWEFKHPEFRINDREALDNIKRKGPTTKKSQPFNGSQDSSLGGINQNLPINYNELLNSFNYLKDTFNHLKDDYNNINKDNSNLFNELRIIKSKYKSVVENLVLIKSYNERYFTSINVLINSLSQQGLKLPRLDLPNPNDIDFSNIHQQQQQIQHGRTPSTSQNLPQNLSNPTSQQPSLPSQPPSEKIGHKRQFSNVSQPFDYQPPVLQSKPIIPMPSQSQPPRSTPNQPQNLTTGPIIQPQGNQNKFPTTTTTIPGSNQTFASATPTSNDQSPLQSPPTTTSNPLATDITVNGSVITTNLPNPKFHVLLVEDDNVCIQLCRKFLVKYGCQVTVVTDGLNAISTVENNQYDLVLMDIVMPNLDGATATSVIRSFDTKTPIIAMTGNIEENDLVTYLQNGMSDILAKPFTKDDLYSILSKHLLGNEPVNVNTVNSIKAENSDNILLDDDQVLKKQRID